MTINILLGVLLPFMGTALGAAGVFFMRGEMNARARSGVIGFAAGIMVAASVWSLILPAVARTAGLGRFAFVPAAVGLLCGVFFLLLLDLLLFGLWPLLFFQTLLCDKSSCQKGQK